MANEITLSASLKATKNNVSVAPLTTSKVQTMQSSGSKMHHTVQSVGFAAKEILSVGDVDVTKQYWVLLYNRDATNFVTVYLRKDVTPTDVDAGIILPGEPYGPVRMQLQTGGYPVMYLQADTAACNVEVVVTDGGNPSL
jgi:hypothetical protein